MTYWRNNLLFLFFRFFTVFNCDTSCCFLYVAIVKITSSLWLFGNQPDFDWKYRNDCTKKHCQENIPHSLAKEKLQGKNKNKLSDQLDDAMSSSTYFKIYRRMFLKNVWKEFSKTSIGKWNFWAKLLILDV